jgi:CheY-like chemotaxis protein
MQAWQRLSFPHAPALHCALVVDVDPVNRSILSKQLSILGIDVITYSSGVAALALPDLVLTDHDMLDMDGL